MKTVAFLALALAWDATRDAQAQQPSASDPVPVTADNFVRAESDLYFGNIVKRGGFGRFDHNRGLAAVDDSQLVVRSNRDTLYSGAVFDLDAGPVTITTPDAGKRFMSMQVIDEDQYTHRVAYEPGSYTFTRNAIGTRYVIVFVRTFVDPGDPEDIRQVHALQNAIRTVQPGGPGKFEVPHWDRTSQDKVRDALLVLASTLPDQRRMFGSKAEVDPVRFIIGAAMGWAGNPDKDAVYLIGSPAKNDGKTNHELVVKNVPVDGFWSISLYDAKGYFVQNEYNAYSFNNVTARKSDDGSIRIQFGGCDGKIPNCLPIMNGWNYIVRLYRPRPEVLDGTWNFPEAKPVQ
ncbi:MAG TPA: DUF1254 domain-containing protein [Povalibacter sp.]|uniref:DUF1254 domain-containing protein n=1 Tax=Povalibacter sp. TaxID=1962978 RepID=UPI002D00EB61|nr:DUF1254 domain-containing protein [Povalibacter sp.]HMN43912.1 DUF1254 domain-containing protein [Povalibacter sp.]